MGDMLSSASADATAKLLDMKTGKAVRIGADLDSGKILIFLSSIKYSFVGDEVMSVCFI